MDRNSPESYIEPSAEASLAATREFIEYCQGRGPMVRGEVDAGCTRWRNTVWHPVGRVA